MVGVGAIAAGGGAGTWAFFSDEENTSDNNIQSGTLDLTVTDGDTISYTIQDVAPGDTEGTFANVSGSPTQDLEFNLELANTGSIDDEAVAIYIENSTSNADGGNFANQILVRELNFLGDFIDSNGNPVSNPDATLEVAGTDHTSALSGPITLGDLSNTELKITDPAGDSVLGESQSGTDLSWNYKIDEDMGNDFQGATLDTTFNFALLQDAGQSFSG